MGRDRDEFSGRFIQEYSDEDFVQVVKELGSCSTSDVADHVGCSSDLAYRRLTELAAESRIDSEKVAGNCRWFFNNED
jgi:hypothetical protein